MLITLGAWSKVVQAIYFFTTCMGEPAGNYEAGQGAELERVHVENMEHAVAIACNSHHEFTYNIIILLVMTAAVRIRCSVYSPWARYS